MNERHLQDRFLIPFFINDLAYQEVKANTVASTLIIEEDLQAFISQTTLNQKNYETLLRKYKGDSQQLLAELIDLIQERSRSSRNMALFFNANKSVTLHGIKLYLFYTSDSVVHGDDLFHQNIFSVVQELPYIYQYHDQPIFHFRPDLTFFLNGIYLGYSELKANYTNQTASHNGRRKVLKDYFEAVTKYHQYFDTNQNLTDKEKDTHRKDLLKIFDKAIHITTTDIGQTYVIRNIADYFDEALNTLRGGRLDYESFQTEATRFFKPYPLLNPDADKIDKLKEIFAAHYGKLYLEKEILYYNFIEREVYKTSSTKQLKDQPGQLIAPRPKQKFGTDKILSKIDEFLAYEADDDYFLEQLEKQLAHVSASKRHELIEKRRKYANNKNVYSLLLQYAAGFGKSNIIGWSALQLKDLRRDDKYVYDKIMIVVDRLQLRSQIDSKMLNMNIERSMFVEAHNQKTFLDALQSDTRIVIVNLQKFDSVRKMLDHSVLQRLANLRIVFLIDEIHRSHTGDQHDEMINIFDELQTPFDTNPQYNASRTKKNLIIGFTATPTDHALARFGEFSGYAESEKLWVPFDSYTMKEAIEDGYILNPLDNIIPIAAKMLFDVPDHQLKGFTEPNYKDVDKKQIYENKDRIDDISRYIADLLVKDVYHRIRVTAKAMLAVSSIAAAIIYKERVTKYFQEITQQKKYQKYADAAIYIIYSDSQDKQKASSLNNGLSEQKVLERFVQEKNGLIIVVDKLQTGFDEKKLHTLFLDKEVTGISAIQTISRVNRTAKYKNECKIVDFSYNNVNVQNIKEAFEHFSNVVVSDFDPLRDEGILDIQFNDLKKSDVYNTFFPIFASIFKDQAKRDNPESYLDLENKLERYIHAHPQRTAEVKARAAQYFTILNRIEHVIIIDDKYTEKPFLHFLRKYNALYNLLHRSESDQKDPIEVYFDNQIGIIELAPYEASEKTKHETQIAQGKVPGQNGRQTSILDIIEARNQNEELKGVLIQEFKTKMDDFFAYVRGVDEGKRLIVKIKSQVSEDEIYDDFGKIYRKYRALYRKKVGNYFFDETKDMVEKLCDEFEETVKLEERDAWVQTGVAMLELDTDYYQFTLEKQDEFIIELANIVEANPDDICILHIAPGSVRLTVEMPAWMLSLLLTLFFAGNSVLKRLPVKIIEIKPDSASTRTSVHTDGQLNNLAGRINSLNKANLRFFLTDYFNGSELQNLCFDLSVDYEILHGEGKADKARELITYCERHGLIEELVIICIQRRPNLNVTDLLFDKVPD